ncbi:ferrous iron transport protein B [Ignatzschineria cameli]|uniref:ferrous iron transport protein B n=1 Tax=Ignatzschineria cameli TaxID=2182793 RepID=UPI000D60956F|nr:ferrous iron transport protein B [Ignatzschineria cameli]PWD85323.1 ferrous iron transport protein B [Ignatzschineria cameli]
MIKAALAGQPNSGKSTIFNMMSGIKQHVANYPGVTVEKKSTRLSYQATEIELVDLPGTYSFSAFSMEEKATIGYLIDGDPDVIINVIDASCLRRSLYLTFQLLEIGKPVIVVLNMMDVAQRRGLSLDRERLEELLGVPVVEAVGSKGIGKEEILENLLAAKSGEEARNNRDETFNPQKRSLCHYAQIADDLDRVEAALMAESVLTPLCERISPRWLALKLLEDNQIIKAQIATEAPDFMARFEDFELQPPKSSESPKSLKPSAVTLNLDGAEKAEKIESAERREKRAKVDAIVVAERYQVANSIYQQVVTEPTNKKPTLTALIDKVVLNRWLSFFILGLVIYGTYELSIVQGYELTNYTWPYLASVKNFIVSLLPDPQFIEVPMVTELGIWLVNSALALLNYIPIFLILFIIIAILEDTGYMPRIAFVLDRIFNRYGLHGQSTLPLVLGGAFVGGCAVPGIMATKGIADERARIATILTVPYMNCLAKVPFYTLILGAFFATSMSLMMFFISTITFFIALSIARFLTLTILKHHERTPFIMELPPYHLPTIKGVLIRAIERIWLYIHKVGTIVMAVAVVLFVLLQFPGLSEEKQQEIDQRVEVLFAQYDEAIHSSPYYQEVSEPAVIYQLINLNNHYRAARMVASQSPEKASGVDAKYEKMAPQLFRFIKPQNSDERLINREIRKLSQQGQLLQNEIKNERITNSFLGMFGRFLEPVTKWAGFDWRINVAFLSSFAARESAVATIGSIYESGKAERAEEAFRSEATGYNALHAVAMLIFMIFTPPCIASMVVVKLNVNSYKLMLLAIFMPFILGLLFASLFYTLGNYFSWSGLETMGYFYGFIVLITLILGFVRRTENNGALDRVDGTYRYRRP